MTLFSRLGNEKPFGMFYKWRQTMYVFIFLVKVTEWPPIGKIAAHSAYDMFHGIKYLIVSLVFSHLGFLSGNRFLIAPFPDLCLLVPFYDGHDLKLLILVGWGWSFLSVAWPIGVQLVFFFCSRFSVMLLGAQGSPSPGSLLYL